jgi:peroxiredoxin
MTLKNHSQKPAYITLMKLVAAYYLLAGLVIVLFPNGLAALLEGDAAISMVMARWLGIISVSYGIGLALASPKPLQSWRILLVGFIAALLLVLVTLLALARGQIPGGLGWVIILANLLGAVPLTIILYAIADLPLHDSESLSLSPELPLDQFKTREGHSLRSLSNESPVLLVLLRHLGCTFCRETLADIAAHRREIESTGARIIFAHMGDDDNAAYLFERYHLEDIARISDPDARLYKALGLSRASLNQVYGPGMWKYVIQSVLLDGHGMGQVVGDRFQMPGAFLLHHGAVVGGFRHERISDHPDYRSIVQVAAPDEDITY